MPSLAIRRRRSSCCCTGFPRAASTGTTSWDRSARAIAWRAWTFLGSGSPTNPRTLNTRCIVIARWWSTTSTTCSTRIRASSSRTTAATASRSGLRRRMRCFDHSVRARTPRPQQWQPVLAAFEPHELPAARARSCFCSAGAGRVDTGASRGRDGRDDLLTATIADRSRDCRTGGHVCGERWNGRDPRHNSVPGRTLGERAEVAGSARPFARPDNADLGSVRHRFTAASRYLYLGPLPRHQTRQRVLATPPCEITISNTTSQPSSSTPYRRRCQTGHRSPAGPRFDSTGSAHPGGSIPHDHAIGPSSARRFRRRSVVMTAVSGRLRGVRRGR